MAKQTPKRAATARPKKKPGGAVDPIPELERRVAALERKVKGMTVADDKIATLVTKYEKIAADVTRIGDVAESARAALDGVVAQNASYRQQIKDLIAAGGLSPTAAAALDKLAGDMEADDKAFDLAADKIANAVATTNQPEV